MGGIRNCLNLWIGEKPPGWPSPRRIKPQKKPPFTESLSLARQTVADLISLAGNTTQRRKDRKAFLVHLKIGLVFSVRPP